MAKFWSKERVETVACINYFYISKILINQPLGLALLSGLFGLGLITPVTAQVSPDGSLGTEANTDNNITEITGGTRSESNLFHSFQEFSVETGAEAFFNNAVDINNIIGRVTGGNISNIDGLIRANGDANLILINPNGITLGNNARLDIGGSFLGSTADSVVFQDGTVFNTDLETQPLLTISAPVGLQLGQNSAEIRVSGAGLDPMATTPGNTFALVGNGITFDGATVEVESGRIELGSVGEGEVSITEIASGWQLGYAGVRQLGNLELLNESALINPNLANNSTGGIQLQGSNITLERSQITAQTLADAPGGNIVINAAESLTLFGVVEAGENASQISNNVLGSAAGVGGSIEINTGKLAINPRSFIDSNVFGPGSAGDINITAGRIDIAGAGFQEFQQQYRVDVLEGNLQPGSRITGIFAGTATTGKAGDISIDTGTLNLTDGAIIFTPVFTAGNGGDIDITAEDIDLDASAIQNGGGRDSIASATVGDINLNSDRLEVANGATVINATFGKVNGGNVSITAEDINLNSSSTASIIGTGLFTSSTQGSGAGGDLNITAANINIEDSIIASNSGAILADGTTIPVGGLGGDIKIRASDTIEASGIVFSPDDPQLAVGSGIATSTYSTADGGDLTVDTGKLIIRDGASFASATFGGGNGGHLTIDAAESVEIIGSAAEGMNLSGLSASSNNNLTSNSPIAGTSGNIKITTPNLTVTDGAIIDVRSTNQGDAGNIELLSNDSIVIADGAALSATTEDGAGGSVKIKTNTIQLDRGLINASVLGSGTGGNIKINAEGSVEITGSGFAALQENLFNPDLLSPEFLANLSIDRVNQGILAASTDSGNAGTIDIQAGNIVLESGGLIAAATGGSGSAGTISLSAAESLKIDGSFVSNNTLFDGRGNNISVKTQRLEILQGGQITASTLGMGDSGNVRINATESILVEGNGEDLNSVSNISVGAGVQSLPSTGNGGNLTIETADLKVDRGAITIGSVGSGDAGGLKVNAESIVLDNQGRISADTESGNGGNVSLEADSIIWRGASFTTATAQGAGNGGNVTILADNLVALEGSSIIANAFTGNGGNIQVNAEGLFICNTCQVTASSELGVDGVVNIETLEPTTALDALSVQTQPTQDREEVAIACPNEPGANASQLTVIGRGGLPNRPQELLNARSLIEFEPKAEVSTPPTKTTLPNPARGWYRNADGKVILTAQATTGSANNSPIKAVDCHD